MTVSKKRLSRTARLVKRDGALGGEIKNINLIDRMGLFKYPRIDEIRRGRRRFARIRRMNKRPGLSFFSLASALAAPAFVLATSAAPQEVLPRPDAVRGQGRGDARAVDPGLAYLPGLRKKGEHGKAFDYKTVSTEVLGWVLQRVTGNRSPNWFPRGSGRRWTRKPTPVS
jgi:hypothetical protein